MTKTKAHIDTPSGLEARILQALETWFESYNEGQIENCVACYHDDATILMAETPAITGREAILAAHKEWKKAEPGLSKSYELLEWGGSGDWAFCLNSFKTYKNGGDRKDGVPDGLVQNLLKREANGDYHFYWTSLHLMQEG